MGPTRSRCRIPTTGRPHSPTSRQVQIQGSLPVITSADKFRMNIYFGVVPVKQYLRVQVTAASTSSGGLVGATSASG
jgi:hypothetical protein